MKRFIIKVYTLPEKKSMRNPSVSYTKSTSDFLLFRLQSKVAIPDTRRHRSTTVHTGSSGSPPIVSRYRHRFFSEIIASGFLDPPLANPTGSAANLTPEKTPQIISAMCQGSTGVGGTLHMYFSAEERQRPGCQNHKPQECVIKLILAAGTPV